MNFTPGLIFPKPTDRKFLASPLPLDVPAPEAWDTRHALLESSDQGSSSECAAYAMAGFIEYRNRILFDKLDQINPAPIYKEAKRLDGEPNQPGTTLHAVVQAAENLGLIPVVDKDTFQFVNADQYPLACFKHGVVLISFLITDAWMHPTADGWIPDGGRELGGHAVLGCGYDDTYISKPRFVQNSWGEDHGWRGFNRMTQAQFNSSYMGGLIWNYKQGEQ